MSTLKRKSNIALIVVTIIILLLIPIWYAIIVPSIITSEIEKMDTTTSYEGTLGKQEYAEFLDDIIASEIERIDATTNYTGTLRGWMCNTYYDVLELPILVKAHLYADGASGDNVILRLEVETMNATDPDKLNKLEEKELTYNSTFVVNKFNRTNVWDAPEADKNRTGYYDPLYPSHLEEGENITNVWLDMLNTTGTLEYVGKEEKDGVTLYKYFVNETIWKPMNLTGFLPNTIFTLRYTKTIWIEPLSGMQAYTEDETFYLWYTDTPPFPPPENWFFKLVYPLTYKNTDEAKDEGIELAKSLHDDMEFLELLHSDPPKQIQIEASAKAIGVKGDNVIVKIDAEMTRTDTDETLPDFAQNLTYVFNKFTRENDPEATDADKPRSGYDPLYPSHLRKGQNITAWFDTLNTTATLEFVESKVEDGVTLYRYSGTETITNITYMGFTDSTLSLTRTVLIEPLSGLPAYTENETFCFNTTRAGYPPLPIVYLTYWSTPEAKTDGLETAKMGYEGIQLLELFLPTIFGAVIIILIIGLAFNIRRLERKKTEAKTKPPAPRR